MNDHDELLARLRATIAARRGADPKESYVASLLAKGRGAIGRKIAEEALEVAIAAAAEGREQIIYESADMLFHLLVLLESEQIGWEEILAELARREGLSGLEEKAGRKA